MQASGTFTVKLEPQSPAHADSGLGRMSIYKQFSGDLEARSLGEMLAYRGTVDGSAGYVAMERVVGTLHGRQGAFVLQHSGTMDRGASGLLVSVVPDSGTDALAGLTGTLAIHIDAQGGHSYTFDYRLP
ncbi:DUF3224 domain-containing protein [Rhodanobacter sp. DHG33]|uniref:DUF3224 domain-containing protein n=1 Tax=Rhodanobacter sp. DHG33 TaxID=2775921 RepID=UPI00177C857B|nr:DUF3224 domain-containing protein [Rhodanobacter sp. DHG33]MBD8899244.1 DUF3224 domain-containing protein [Rhodanobacter sp. DHG33]